MAASAEAEDDYRNMGKGQTEEEDNEDPSIYFDLIDDEEENNKTGREYE